MKMRQTGTVAGCSQLPVICMSVLSKATTKLKNKNMTTETNTEAELPAIVSLLLSVDRRRIPTFMSM